MLLQTGVWVVVQLSEELLLMDCLDSALATGGLDPLVKGSFLVFFVEATHGV